MSRSDMNESCSCVISDVITNPDLSEIGSGRGVVRSVRVVGQKDLAVLDALEV